MKRPKVTVVGAGHVGATTAQRIAERELADVVLVDIVEGLPQGKALDMMEARPLLHCDCVVTGSNDYAPIAGSEVVVITAGLPRKPGMSRDDLLQKNAAIVGGVVDNVVKHAPGAKLILVSNPLDVMTHLACEKSGFEKNRVMGMAGVLDSTRFAYFIAEALGIGTRDVNAMVLGGHGDQMVPLPRYSTVNGIPVTELLPEEKIRALIERTKQGGAEIVGLMKTASAFYAPSASVTEMVDSIVRDNKRILPVCAKLEGEYGLEGVFLGVPVKLGSDGVEAVIEITLSDTERAALAASAAKVKENIAKAKCLG
ncbi:MAG: malate dehydrogenase [Planctomycetes bacterium]|nr:malate dehydrogenase [Planctomycetota bacterium]